MSERDEMIDQSELENPSSIEDALCELRERLAAEIEGDEEIRRLPLTHQAIDRCIAIVRGRKDGDRDT